jgi:hypothetical protein
MILKSHRWLGGVACWTVLSAAAFVSAADFQKAALELRDKYTADIEQLAKWCDDNALGDEAKKTRRVLPPNDPYKLFVPILPVTVGPDQLPADSPANVVEWGSRLNKLRRDHAAALYDIARHSVRAGRAGLAFDLAILAIQTDPDYEPARRLFGYQKFRDEWRTVYEVKKLRADYAWSDKFGWLPKAHLRRYEEGQRFDDGRWMPAAEDAKRHRDIRSGWDVESANYSIRTDLSIEAAVALSVKLDRLNRLWRQLFVRYYASEADVIALFDGRAKAAQLDSLRHNVVYFRDRDDYNRSLRPAMPKIEITVGAYIEQTRRSYFFPDPENDDRTLYHEATHQLFHESRPVIDDVGRRRNFWIVEGIAMYMESLRQEDGDYVLGGLDDQRLHAARYRLLHDKFYVPLAELTAYGREKVQKDPRIATLYSQAAGLTHFLIHFDGGRYRDALVAYLVAVYTGKDGPDTLAKLTGASYSELDKQYRKFLERGGGD